jgi:hypothetical protein
VVLKRTFTVEEANRMVPRLVEMFSQVMQLRSQLKTLYKKLEARGFAPSEDQFTPDVPGASPDVVKDRAAFKGLVELLRAEVGEISALGCEIKDIEIGLVDWYARVGDRDVLLCWRFGEPEVAWWHDLDAGFAGRRPVSELATLAQAKPRSIH